MIKTRISKGIRCHDCPANFLCLPRNLTLNEINQLNKLITTVKIVAKKEYVFHADTAMQSLYAVHKGSCKESWIDENGNELITNFYFPGDLIGIESVPQRKHMFSVTALEKSELCVIPIEPFFHLMNENNNILKRFVNITSFKMQNDQSSRMSITANERVCDFILNILSRMHERNPTEKNICFPMSQLDISNFLGIAYETVNRIFQNLKRKKIIKMKNKTLNVLDLAQLEKLGRLEYSPQKQY